MHNTHRPSQENLSSYLRTANNHLNLTTVRAHQHSEFLTDTLQNTQPVVLGKRLEEVLQDVLLVGAAGDLLQLRDDLRLVARRQGRRVEDRGQLRVPLERLAESGEGLGGLLERGGLCGCRVLSWEDVVSFFFRSLLSLSPPSIYTQSCVVCVCVCVFVGGSQFNSIGNRE